MARRGFRAEEEEAELNMTPMLDVVFILLIFFIVTAVFVKEPGIDVSRPEVNSFDENLRETILVAISNEDEVWINRRQVDIRDIRPVIEALRAENPQGGAIVQGDATARFSVVYEVMETLQSTGVPTQYVSVRPN